ncbi:capsid protein [Limosilactobacillus sp. c9Ua_26_M]|uniref:Capsid protein n=1 Tax=Limosilactobacillus urinaemulieris TaxID=2742600 RepID=A0ABR8ZJS3_9LACO|nr:minor capsid protein [Limosilactobacillus urinaemulieris]MBD8085550.1 capsid protein [Limosilactobacillus urinaemulieris]
MSVRVSYNGKKLADVLSGRSLQRAQYILVNQVAADMDQFIPYKEGHLAKQIAISLDGKSILYTVPYAKAQFYGLITNRKTGKVSQVQNYTPTEGRSPSKRWDLRAKSLYGDVWANKVKKSLLEGN